MAVINYAKKEISAKIVYYGPSLCGKTTNLQYIYASVTPDQKGKLVSLATEADRTLFFDFLPIEIADIRGFKTRLHFYTVPGQVFYNSTRRAVLTGVDGIVFVADSQRDKMEENIESLKNLEENLNYYGKSLQTTPLVLQYNKRDLPDVSPAIEMEQLLNPNSKYPFFEAIATTGNGVLPTLTKITKMVLKHIESGTSGKPQRPAEPSISFDSQPAAAAVAPQETTAPTEPKEDITLPDDLPEEQPPAAPAAEFEIPAESGPDIDEYNEPLQAEPSYDFSQEDLTQAPSAIDEIEPEPSVADLPQTGFSGGRIQIVGTGDASIISANALSVPIKVKIEGDERTFMMELAIKLDSLIPEDS